MRLTGLLIILIIIFLSYGNLGHLPLVDTTKTTKNTTSKPINKLNPVIENVYLDHKYLQSSRAISIDGNSELLLTAQALKWPGNGSKANPFVIQNIYFSDRYTTPDLVDISIKNTDLHILIQNIYMEFLRLSDQQLLRMGIQLQSCSNIIIKNTFFISSISNYNAHMIDILNGSDIQILQNYFNTTQSVAVNIRQSSQINVTSNYFKNNFNGIYMGFNVQNISISENNFQRNIWAVEYLKGNETQVANLNNSISNNYV